MEKIIVQMKKTLKGSLDGINVGEFLIGNIYEIPKSLANDFISKNAAEVFQPSENKENVTKEKAISEAPMNKAFKSAPKNKSIGNGDKK